MNERRQYKRISKEMRIEYGPFSSLFSRENLKTGTVKNLSGSGVLFRADERLPVGSKIVLKMYLAGWRHEHGFYLQADQGQISNVYLKAIAEIVRVEHDLESGIYRTGARFVGRIH